MKQIEDKSIDMILCDLPYGTTNNNWDVIINLEKLWEKYNRIIKDRGVIVLTAIQPFSSMLVMSNIKIFKYEWIWVKNRNTNYLNSKHQPLRNSEHILVFYRKIPSFNQIPFSEEEYKYRAEATKNKSGSKNYGSHIIKQDTMVRKPISAKNVLYFDTVHPDSKDYLNHPTQKPVELFEYLIKTYTNEGDLVLDNCIGSGTTAVACVNTKRNFIGMELSEDYCKIANERLRKKG
jgi:site-specific DNA-methyltransferase (adenine-specific)